MISDFLLPGSVVSLCLPTRPLLESIANLHPFQFASRRTCSSPPPATEIFIVLKGLAQVNKCFLIHILISPSAWFFSFLPSTLLVHWFLFFSVCLFIWKSFACLTLLGHRLLGGWGPACLSRFIKSLREKGRQAENSQLLNPLLCWLRWGKRRLFLQLPATLGGRKRHIPVGIWEQEAHTVKTGGSGIQTHGHFISKLSCLPLFTCCLLVTCCPSFTWGHWHEWKGKLVGCCYRNTPGPPWAGIVSSKESLLSLCNNRKGLEHFMCERCKCLWTVSCLQVPPSKIMGNKICPNNSLA